MILPVTTLVGTIAWSIKGNAFDWQLPLASLLALFVAGGIWQWLNRHNQKVVALFERQSNFLERAVSSMSKTKLAISLVIVTTLSLLLELSFIRWMASLYEIFAFYKNFTLLACFAGLGVGYATSRRQLTFPAFIPCFSVGIIAIVLFRYLVPDGFQYCLFFLPVLENLAMGSRISASSGHFLAIYIFLALNFVFTASVFLPLGQLSGRLMRALPNLQAYGLNLVGSLVGVLVMLIMGQCWAPPLVWFGIALCLALYLFSASRQAVLATSLLSLVCLMTLGSAATFGVEYIYSPYQVLEKRIRKSDGIIQIRAANNYYQRIVDLSETGQKTDFLKRIAQYYEMPFRFKPNPDEVLVIGAGTGNDVAAALRCGAKHVDAVEIDTAIAKMGKEFHPEDPYGSDKVSLIVDDARQFLKKTKKKYDVIVFGLLDSHTAISQASQLRTDSYIYTVEAFKEVRDRLKDDGIISLAFASLGPELDQKLNLMVKSAFNAPPIRIASFYDGEVTLVQSRSGKIAVPDSLMPLLQSKYFQLVPEGVNEPTGIELSTDNWPFFYMPHKAFPMSYLPMLVLIVIIALTMLYSLECFNEPTDAVTPAFFLLGSGFMLIETKAITELALYFGNTWIVTGITIGAILTMAFVANLIVDKIAPSRPLLPLLGVLGSLGLGLWAHHYLPQSNEHAGALVATLLATLPIAFSGVVFSTLFRSAKSVGMAMSANILGALVGGAMEYFALWLGYEALYVMAIVVYALAALSFLALKGAGKTVTS
ncbi:unnamed protein product [Sphagnum balticum]